MKAIITLEHRFYSYKGELYTLGAFDQKFWKRYLDIFSEVLIVARVRPLLKLEGNEIRVSSDRIKFYELDSYIGAKQGFMKLPSLKRKLNLLADTNQGAYILRIGSPIADLLVPILKKRSIPYAVEVVGDPWDVFAKGAISHPVRPLLRLYFAYKLKKQCAGAKFSSYVTEHALQKRYPPRNSVKTINASSINLSKDFLFENKTFGRDDFDWVFVGTLEQFQKAPDILIRSFKILLNKHPRARLNFVGDGRKRLVLEELAISLGVQDSIYFHGSVASSEQVREFLVSSPFFVLPSRGEGLPRAMIEAMACSCLCVGSDIGGIRELIDAEWIAPVNDVEQLAQKMIKIMDQSVEQKNIISSRNFHKAKDYLGDKLEIRRKDFYLSIKNHLEEVL
tara:strand:+ start:1811 stop:2989 length:1179 start_codon:yes stop_codon:yes gene_type:complete